MLSRTGTASYKVRPDEVSLLHLWYKGCKKSFPTFFWKPGMLLPAPQPSRLSRTSATVGLQSNGSIRRSTHRTNLRRTHVYKAGMIWAISAAACWTADLLQVRLRAGGRHRLYASVCSHCHWTLNDFVATPGIGPKNRQKHVDKLVKLCAYQCLPDQVRCACWYCACSLGKTQVFACSQDTSVTKLFARDDGAATPQGTCLLTACPDL